MTPEQRADLLGAILLILAVLWAVPYLPVVTEGALKGLVQLQQEVKRR